MPTPYEALREAERALLSCSAHNTALASLLEALLDNPSLALDADTRGNATFAIDILDNGEDGEGYGLPGPASGIVRACIDEHFADERAQEDSDTLALMQRYEEERGAQSAPAPHPSP